MVNFSSNSLLERRNSLYDAALGKYKDMHFEIYEPKNASIELEISRYGAIVQQYKYGEPHPSTLDIQNACQCHLIKNGEFGTLGIEAKGAQK